jgi:hypothetical protein
LPTTGAEVGAHLLVGPARPDEVGDEAHPWR